MAQQVEISGQDILHEPKRTETMSTDMKESVATLTRLLRIGILTLGVLCIIQAVLNISLLVAFHSEDETDWFPFNSSVIAEVCQIDQSLQNPTQSCSCCHKLLRRLQREYQALKTERDLLHHRFTQRETTEDDDDFSESGFGALEVA